MGVRAGGVTPSRKGVRGYYPRETVYTFYAPLCILECRIGIVYGYDNVVVVGFLCPAAKSILVHSGLKIKCLAMMIFNNLVVENVK